MKYITKLIMLILMLNLILFSNQVLAEITAAASSEESNDLSADKAVDNDMSTRWSSSFNDNQWIELDLSRVKNISGLYIFWENAFAIEYEILVSKNRIDWDSVFTEKNSDGAVDNIMFNKRPVQYLKIKCIKRGTEYGNSIFEIILNEEVTPPAILPDKDMENITGEDLKQYLSSGLINEDPLILKGLKQLQDISSPEKQLLPSMEGNQCQTFNNSLVALAFMVKNERERAERILDFFSTATVKNMWCQDLQNFFYKGEARGFYQFVTLRKENNFPAYCNSGQSDRWMGDMAWLLAAYKYYEKKYKSFKYVKITNLLKNLLISWYKDDSTGPGGWVQHGWRKGDQKLHEPFGHPEGNIDVYGVFRLCSEYDYARKVKTWLDRTVNGTGLPLDLYTWRVLAYGRDYGYLLYIPEYDSRFRKTLIKNGKPVSGFYHGPDPNINNIWLDGTGHIACAFLHCGNIAKGFFYANQLDAFIVERNLRGIKTHGIPYTANKTGGYDWVDLNKGFISVAAWYIFAKNLFNPLTLKQIDIKVPIIKNPFAYQTKNILTGQNRIIDNFVSPDKWETVSDNDIYLSLKSGGTNEGIFEYQLDGGVWVSFKKRSGIPYELKDSPISFEIKTEGPANNFEFKLIDSDGSVFGYRMDNINFPEYQKKIIEPHKIKHFWGGDNTLNNIKEIEITISKTEGGRGKFFIKNLS